MFPDTFFGTVFPVIDTLLPPHTSAVERSKAPVGACTGFLAAFVFLTAIITMCGRHYHLTGPYLCRYEPGLRKSLWALMMTHSSVYANAA